MAFAAPKLTLVALPTGGDPVLNTKGGLIRSLQL
jgi:hypothetical protein